MMSLPQPAQRERMALVLAVGSIALWFLVVTLRFPRPIQDERYHYPIITKMARGRMTLVTHEVPMLTGYHLIAAGAARLFGARPTVARGVSAAMAVLAVFVFRATLRLWRPSQVGDGLLHLVWLPFLFPVLCMAYTEAAAMLFIVVALHQHLRKHWMASAGALLLACLVRQSNVAWVLFFAVWAVVEGVREHRAHEGVRPGAFPGADAILRRTWPHLSVLTAAAAFFLTRGEVGMGNRAGLHPNNVGAFNPAQFYDLAFFSLGLWAPIWLERARDELRALRRWFLHRPHQAVPAAMLAAAAVVGLALVYWNPNRWNHGQMEFIRNWPLEAMDRFRWMRPTGAAIAIVAAMLVARFVSSQPDRLMLSLTWGVSLVFLAPHFLVEPRYYIVPFFLVNFFTNYTVAQARRMTAWCGALSLASCAAVLANRIW